MDDLNKSTDPKSESFRNKEDISSSDDDERIFSSQSTSCYSKLAVSIELPLDPNDEVRIEKGVLPTWERDDTFYSYMKEETPEKEIIRKRRLSIKPLNPKYVPIYKQWEKHVASFWTHREIDYSQDRKDIKIIDDIERTMLGGVTAFFAGGDTLINSNIAEFARLVPDDYLEIKLYWSDQMSREGIHQVTYSEMIEAVWPISDHEKFFNAIENWESIANMSEWMSIIDHEIDDKDRLATSIIINICAEGIFFSAAFSFIFWFKSRGLFPGLSFGNEKISIDEANHAITAVIFYLIEFITLLNRTAVLNHNSLSNGQIVLACLPSVLIAA